MQTIVYTLLNYMNCCIKKDTDYDIAKCLLLNIRKLSKLSLEDTAILCNVSASTLNRFCRTIGFANFSTVKKLLRNHDLPFDYDSFIQSHIHSNDYMDQLTSGLNKIESIQEDVFNRITKLMEQASHIHLLGYGDFHYQAGYFQNIMLYHGKLLEINSQNESLRHPIQVESHDLIIITSLSGGYVRDMKSKLDKIKCHKVLITQKNDQNFKDFDVVVEIGENKDKNINKYLIMRVYEKMISSYYFYKTSQKLTSL